MASQLAMPTTTSGGSLFWGGDKLLAKEKRGVARNCKSNDDCSNDSPAGIADVGWAPGEGSCSIFASAMKEEKENFRK
jgi:hypothetical protein